MEVLVTGASGFLGGILARALIQKGDKVRILVRETSNLDRLKDMDIEIIYGSLEQKDSLIPAVKDMDIIYHCAAVSTDWAPWKDFENTNIKGVRNLCEAAADEKELKRFLHISTTDVYGYPEKPCDESHPITNVGLPYNRSKGIGEEIVWEFFRGKKLPVTVIRPVTIYGPGSMDLVKDVIDLIIEKKMVLINKGISNAGLLYVENAVDTVIKAAESLDSIGQVYNIRDQGTETWKEYVAALEKELGITDSWSNIPLWLAYGMGYVSEKLYGLLRIKKRPLITRHIVYMSTRDQGYSIDKITNELGYTQKVPFEDGIKRTVEWYNTTTKTSRH